MQAPHHTNRCAGHNAAGLRMLLVALFAAWACAAKGVPPPETDSPSEGEAASAVELPSPIGALRYTPGRGLRLGETGVTLGGYSNVHLVRDEGGPAALCLDEFSLFTIWDPTPRFRVFSELEFENLVSVDDQGHGGTAEHSFHVERLYGDLTISDQFHLRTGKFLTPVGRWNPIHAEPLVWTTSRPLATLLPFDQRTMGAMLFGSVFPATGRVAYALFGQFMNQFERVEQAQSADRSAGARVAYTTDSGWSVGHSLVAFSQAGDWHHLAGLDTLWQRQPFEVMGELAFEDGPHRGDHQWGLYLQSAVEIHPRVFLVGRYEHYDQPTSQPEVNLFVAGMAYKPLPYAILKAEYVAADHPADASRPGFLTSFGLLF